MKHRHLIALAGAAAMIAGSPVHAIPTLTAVVNQTNPFLVANELQSVVISITGFDAGTAIRGIKGTAEVPWIVDVLFEGVEFFNIDSVENPTSPTSPLFTDGFYAAPSNNGQLNAMTANTAQWDTGLIGSLSSQPNLNILGVPTDTDPNDDVGGFALHKDSGDDTSIAPMSWMNSPPGGIAVGSASNFRVLRATVHRYAMVRIQFVLVMTTGEEFPMSANVGPLGPYGACCLPSGECFVNNQASCSNQGGKFHAKQACHIACVGPPPCPADLAPAGGDDVVNVADLLAVISAWGACGSPNDCPADIAPAGGDDTVNVADLLAVISAWGPCPR